LIYALKKIYIFLFNINYYQKKILTIHLLRIVINFIIMKLINKLGVMQGRLTPMIGNKIQSFPKKNWQKEFSLARKLNIRYVEWTLDYKDIFSNPIFVKSKIKKISFLKKKYSINIISLTGDCFMQKPFWKVHNSAKLINDFKKIVKACSALKIKYIIVPIVDKGKIEAKWQEIKLIDELNKLNKFLKNYRVKILFESDYKPKLLSKFINKLDKSIYGINYDIGNSASLDYDVNEEFRYYGKRIKNIHIKDRLINGTTVRLGMGNANFKKLFKNIKKLNYKGLLILQTARAPIKNKDINEIQTNISFIRDYL